MLGDLTRNLRWTWRGLKRRPAFTITAVLSLAVGIGASTAIFSVVDSVLLQPLPLREPQALVALWSSQEGRETGRAKVSEADLVDWRRRQTRFEAIVGGHNRAITWLGEQETAKLSAVIATDDFFSVLGARAQLGRVFVAEDLDRSRVLLSHRFWQQHLGADRNVVGRRLQLDGRDHTVIGVLTADFAWPRTDVDVFLVRRLVPDQRREHRLMYTFGRLAPGVLIPVAQEEMRGIASELAAEHPQNGGWGVEVVPLVEQVTGPVAAPLRVLLAAAVLLLVIAGVNVAGLMLSQSARRAREVAMCRALGAGRWRVHLRWLLESLQLAVLGGLLGFLGARLALPVFLALEPGSLPRTTEIEIDSGSALFAWLLTLSVALVCGWIPAWKSGRMAPVETLRRVASGTSGGRMRPFLVVAEVGLACVLLLAAGLLVRTFDALVRVDPGFRSDQLAVVRVFIRPGSLKGQELSDYFTRLEQALADTSGVQAIGGGTKIPFSHIGLDLDSPLLEEEHLPERAAEAPSVSVRGVTPAFFEALQIPLVSGRGFDSRDRFGASPAVLVNRALAEQIWPGENPLGKTVRFRHGQWKPREVVGVVGDLLQDGPGGEVRPEAYLPHTQLDFYTGLAYGVRTHGDAEALLEPLRQTVLRFDPLQPPHTVTTMVRQRDGQVAGERFAASVVGFFAVCALLLAAIGLYGVISSMVTERRREIGVRLALGARGSQILALVERRVAVLLLGGLGLGALASLWVSHLLEGLLFGVSPFDLSTILAVGILLSTSALVAAWVPAREALAVDPAETLRYD